MSIVSFPSRLVPMNTDAPDTVALFGLPISNVTMAEAVERIDQAIQHRELHQIATANLDFARNALRSNNLQRVICDCSMVLPDGAPMLWASRLLGKPLKERVTGVDLIPQLAKLSAKKGYRIFLLGSNEQNSSLAQQVLEESSPGVQIVGRYSPPISTLETMDNDAILEKIKDARPDILLVAFGNPKQELWLDKFKHRMTVPVLIGIGGSLEMISGKLRRAPLFFQKLQIEWLYRMAQEPGRLLPRYVRDAAALIRHLPLSFAVSQAQPNDARIEPLLVRSSEGTREIVLPTRFSGKVCHAVKREMQEALAERQNVRLNMCDVLRVDADGLGCLMEVRRLLHAHGLVLSLTETSPAVCRVMEYSAVKGLFLFEKTTEEPARMPTLGIADGGLRLVTERPSGTSHQRANVA